MRAVIAVLDDLFFTVKIADGAKRAGLLPVTFLRTEDAVLKRLSADNPSVVVVDLNCAAVDSIALGVNIKRDFPATSLIGFVSHVQTELRKSAEHAGYDVVLARSVFSTRLAEVLREYST